MKRVLFVDDEPLMLKILERTLKDLRDEWEMSFVQTSSEALGLMAQNPYDVVVTDTLVPGCDGMELLAQVARKYPNTVRIVLSGHSGSEKVVRMLGPAHQYIGKPCKPEVLRESIERAFGIRHLLQNAALQRVVTQLQSLPSMPAHYVEMMDELRQADPSIERLSGLVAADPGLCTKLIRLVNSPAFGLAKPVTNPAEVIMHLGLATVKNIVISLQLFTVFDTVRLRRLPLDQLWRHSWAVGQLTRQIAEHEQLPNREHAFVCGLMHDLGKLVLATGMPVQYQAILDYTQQRNLPIRRAEKEFLGATHAEVGAYLLGLWGLPLPVVDAIAAHHEPATSFNLSAALQIANTMVTESGATDPTRLDLEYLRALGVQDRLPLWQSLPVST